MSWIQLAFTWHKSFMTQMVFSHAWYFQLFTMKYLLVHHVGTPLKSFVVLNLNSNHWVTARNIFCEPNELCIYDILNTKLLRTLNKFYLGCFIQKHHNSSLEYLPCRWCSQAEEWNCQLCTFKGKK